VPKAHQNIATRADQKEIAVESHQNIAVKSCPERIAAKSHQNIAVKAVQRNGCRISPKMLLRELPRENCCRSSPKYCCQICPQRLLPNLNQILLRKLPREKTWDDSWRSKAVKTADGIYLSTCWQNQSSQVRQQLATTPSQLQLTTDK